MISKAFRDVIITADSGCSVHCEWCDRIHYVIGAESDSEEGQLEKLSRLRDKEPNRYQPWNHRIPYGSLAERQVVLGCPCNKEKVEPYEQFIWTHRLMITEYLIKRATSVFADAHQVAVIGDLKEVLERLEKLEYKRIVKR